MVVLFCRLDRTSAKAAARSSAAAAFGILQRRGGVRSRVTHCAAAMASARTAPRGEFVYKHFRALARGVGRLWESHVSRTFLWAINECVDALIVQFLAQRGCGVAIVECVRAALVAQLSIDSSPRGAPIYAPRSQ